MGTPLIKELTANIIATTTAITAIIRIIVFPVIFMVFSPLLLDYYPLVASSLSGISKIIEHPLDLSPSAYSIASLKSFY